MSDKKTRGRPPEYNVNYIDALIDGMEQGQFDYEIFADWNIDRSTFYRWRNKYPEFEQAYQIGLVKCYKWWLGEGRKRFIADGGAAGYKYWISIMNNKFHELGWTRGSGEVTNNISITNQQNTVNLIQNPDDYKLLLEKVKDQAKELNVIDILPIELQSNDESTGKSE